LRRRYTNVSQSSLSPQPEIKKPKRWQRNGLESILLDYAVSVERVVGFSRGLGALSSPDLIRDQGAIQKNKQAALTFQSQASQKAEAFDISKTDR
jgi:hypothetical protein